MTTSEEVKGREKAEDINNINKPWKQSAEWLDKLRVRYAEAWTVLRRESPFMGDTKLLLAHDLALVSRDLFKHIGALEAALSQGGEVPAGPTEEQVRQALAHGIEAVKDAGHSPVKIGALGFGCLAREVTERFAATPAPVPAERPANWMKEDHVPTASTANPTSGERPQYYIVFASADDQQAASTILMKCSRAGANENGHPLFAGVEYRAERPQLSEEQVREILMDIQVGNFGMYETFATPKAKAIMALLTPKGTPPRPEGCICSEAYGVGPEQCGKHAPSTEAGAPEASPATISRCGACNGITEHIGEQCMECFEKTKEISDGDGK